MSVRLTLLLQETIIPTLPTPITSIKRQQYDNSIDDETPPSPSLKKIKADPSENQETNYRRSLSPDLLLDWGNELEDPQETGTTSNPIVIDGDTDDEVFSLDCSLTPCIGNSSQSFLNSVSRC